MADADDVCAAEDFWPDDDVLCAELELDTAAGEAADPEAAELSSEPLAEELVPGWCEVHAAAATATRAKTSPRATRINPSCVFSNPPISSGVFAIASVLPTRLFVTAADELLKASEISSEPIPVSARIQPTDCTTFEESGYARPDFEPPVRCDADRTRWDEPEGRRNE